MEKAIKDVESEISRRLIPGADEYSPLTVSAVKIAELALCSHSGDLLDKALAISKAIVEYEDALKLSVRQ